jgi:hypothetical protein
MARLVLAKLMITWAMIAVSRCGCATQSNIELNERIMDHGDHDLEIPGVALLSQMSHQLKNVKQDV